MRVPEWLERVRKWVDGEEALDEKGQPQPRSKADDFIVSIAREVEKCMQSEMFTPPGQPTYIPREYIVFLSKEDDNEWQGEKREGLERGLQYVLAQRAKELAGENEFQTKTLAIEIRVDGGLEKGKYRVQHVWDSETERTLVKPRKRAEEAKPQAPETDNEATVVRPRKAGGEPLFSLALKRTDAGEDQTPRVYAFHKDEITIGRAASNSDADLKLEGDMEVSRKHATLAKRGDDSFAVTCNGKNSIFIAGREVLTGNTAEVKVGEAIHICSFELVIQ